MARITVDTSFEALSAIVAEHDYVAYGTTYWTYDSEANLWDKDCPRCEGTGYTSFRWVDNGVCFMCNGTKLLDTCTDTQLLSRIKSARNSMIARRKKAEAARLEDERREREAKKAREARLEERRECSHRVGEVGEKVSGRGEIVFTRLIDGYYGCSKLVVIRLEDGSEVKTFSTAKWVWDVERGERVTFTGTVKANEVWEGIETSLLTRVKATKEVRPE